MPVILGSSRHVTNLQHRVRRLCPYCEMMQPADITFGYSYTHMYFFGIVHGKQYVAQCTYCSQESLLDKEEIVVLGMMLPDLDKRCKIAFRHRYGTVIVCGIVGALALSLHLGTI